MKRCSKHPKYNGKKKPTNECGDCLVFYLAIKAKPRMLPKPTKVFKDKSKYTRKKKHKEK